MTDAKVIPFANNYMADENGNIYSKRRRAAKGGALQQAAYGGFGYLGVCLYVDGKKKSHLVHRLVASTFIPNPNNLKEVNHKNGIKSDNRVENLEWIDRGGNQRHKRDVLGYVPPTRKISKEGIFEILSNPKNKKHEFATKFGVGVDNIEHIQRGKIYKDCYREFEALNKQPC